MYFSDARSSAAFNFQSFIDVDGSRATQTY